jgi:hypothetical protein
MKPSFEDGHSLRDVDRKILHRKAKSSLPVLGKQVTSTGSLTSVLPPTTSTTVNTLPEPQHASNFEQHHPKYTLGGGTVLPVTVIPAPPRQRRPHPESHLQIPTKTFWGYHLILIGLTLK